MDTLIVGLDGLDPVMYEKFSSVMPTLSAMSNCKVLSTDPAMTHVAWPTAVSGRNKNQKILMDGIVFRLPPDAWHGSFWDHCPKTCAVINVPYTWDEGQRMTEGSAFAAGMSPSPRKQFHGVPSELIGNWPSEALGGQEGIFDRSNMLDVVRVGENTMVDLVTSHIDTEYMIVGVMSTDYIGHMHYDNEDIMAECYHNADCLVARLVDHYAPKNVIVFSDHGMMPIKDCTERDYPARIVGSGMLRGHSGGHRMHGIYFDHNGARGVENIWDLYYKITEDWGEMSDSEKSLVESRLKALGYM